MTRPKLFRIQYVSDLHLELYSEPPDYSTLLKPCAPYLALAGDIGQPDQLKPFLDWVVPQWKKVFYITGNHEYYNFTKTTKTIKELNVEYTRITDQYENLYFLHADRPSHFLEDENVAIVGLTLWSNVQQTSGWRKVADYSNIRVHAGERTVPRQLNEIHAREVTILESEIGAWSSRGAQLCILTHHMPSYSLIHPRYAMSDVNSCFASNLDALIKPPIRCWIYGHSHACGNYLVKSTMCVINARGYLDEKVPGFTPSAFFEFPTRDPQEVESEMKQGPLRFLESSVEEDVEFM